LPRADKRDVNVSSLNKPQNLSPMRFGKQNRVRLTREFEFLRQNSAKVDCSAFVFYFKKNGSGRSRLGVVTGKRIGSAVERNLARRRIRAIFRETSPSFPESADILIFTRRGILKFEYARLRKKFAEAAERAAKMKDAQNLPPATAETDSENAAK